jgi:iron complex outermembrane receptor protein
MLHTSRYGKVINRPSATTAANDQVFQPKWITDVSLSYKLTSQFSLALSGSNIFDVYPDTNITANQTRGIYLYSGLTPFGFNGAFWSVRATYEYSRIPFLSRRKNGSALKADEE